MKITQVISDTNVGGAGVLISSVIGSLKNDFDFEVIIPKGSALKERLPSGVNVTELKIKGDRSFYPTDVSDFYKFFKKQMPDVHVGILSQIYFREEKYRKPLYLALQLMLLNVLSRPAFVAFKHTDKKAFSFKVCKKLFGVTAFAWTVRTPEKEKAALSAGFDAVIFENYIPE